MELPRSEYPRPQFVRADWECLNGEWQFEIDAGDSGLERGLRERELDGRITVPFCPESTLSGVGHTDFMPAVWYRKTITIPGTWTGRDVLLHFQAVDYDATVWANGVEVGRHRGGFTPFACSLRGIAGAGDEVVIVVRARDDNESAKPRGKQSRQYAPHGCHYTRTTGIWQTVWMEPVPRSALRRPRITPDLANSRFCLELPMAGTRTGLRLKATLSDSEGVVSTAECDADQDFSPRLDLPVPAARCRLWSPADPHLYDVSIVLCDSTGNEVDRVESYAGLRSVTLDGKAVKINGQVIFQRLVLDQGYYPDGVMTAPTDAALRRDIEMAMAAGYNGARLHQKVFEERFLMHADRLGYLVWGEFPDWGCGGMGPNQDHQKPGVTYAAQWLEALERDYSHPAIIGWCPLNETWQNLHDRITVLDDATRAMFLATKAMDTTRPVLDTSGYSHRVQEADIYDSHDYIGDADFQEGLKRFAARHSGMAEDKPFVNAGADSAISIPYCGQPYFVSEFGGIRWVPGEAGAAGGVQTEGWGYGSSPATLEEFYRRFESLCEILLDNPSMFGYCYTQLTDVAPELNGIYTFDRKVKFDMDRIRRAQTREAAIERLFSPER